MFGRFISLAFNSKMLKEIKYAFRKEFYLHSFDSVIIVTCQSILSINYTQLPSYARESGK